MIAVIPMLCICAFVVLHLNSTP